MNTIPARKMKISIELPDGELTGHPDCIISRGELRNVLVDIKTMNERSFTNWKREGTKRSKPQYYDQVHIYAAGLKKQGREIEHLGIVGVNKNNSEMHIEIFDYDPEHMESVLSRTERIMQAEEAPTENSPQEDWCCRYCEYFSECELQATAKPEKLEPEVEYTEDSGVIDAMRELMTARELGKESRDLEAHAKGLLDEHMKQSGRSRINGGGLMFSLTERERRTFDSNAFKKEHPDLAVKYLKMSSSMIYEIKEHRA